MSKYAIGYVVTVFFYGEMTKFKYAGRGEWECISGYNSPGSYSQLLEMLNGE